jgi:hypothetical protein
MNYVTVVEKLRRYHSIVIRADGANPNHHIVRNGGAILWGRLWVYEAEGIKGGRVDFSYETDSYEVARLRRDDLFRQLRQLGVKVIVLHRHAVLPVTVWNDNEIEVKTTATVASLNSDATRQSLVSARF